MKDEMQWQMYQTVNDWLKFADTKATALLGINGILMGLILANLGSVAIAVKVDSVSLIVILLAFGSSILSLLFCLNCLNPRVRFGHDKSLIYFADVAQEFKTSKDYDGELERLFGNNENWRIQLSDQIFTNSIICTKKFKAVSWATRFLVLFIIFLLLATTKVSI